jgi:glycosyltransferase involved in cell wall biosynthesis
MKPLCGERTTEHSEGAQMKLAIMGIRGLPASYSGFETFAEELGKRLVQRGHEVTIYNRSNWIDRKEPEFLGMRLVTLPTISHKYLDTVVHTFVSTIHGLFQDYDVVLMCNLANASFAFIPKLAGQKVALNVDGIERKRKKWNRLGKVYLLLAERIAGRAASVVITDAAVMEQYYAERYGQKSVMIPYGASSGRNPMDNIVRQYGMEPDDYILYVARLEPENNAHVVIEAFEQVVTDKQLVIIGDAPYAREYIQRLKSTKDPRIKFLGFVFGDGYKAFQQSAFAYVQATEVGGTHPALLEAMGFGNYIMANDTPENREVLGGSGILYQGSSELRDAIQHIVDHPAERRRLQEAAMKRIENVYGWEKVTDQYEDLFRRLTKQSELERSDK